MSWLFTVVFSGILFSSNIGTSLTPVTETPKAADTAPAVEVDETEKFEQTYPLNANGKVSVSNVNGSITVEAWDRAEVQLSAVKTADSKERLSEVQIKVDSKPESFSVETKYDDWKQRGDGWRNGGKLEVAYHLMVPRGASLNEIETVNGSVTVSNFTSYTKISAVNGSVRATNLRGTASLSTVNGEVSADFSSLDSQSKINLNTVNGKVNLTIPSDSSATIKVDSLNGSITNDFGLPVRKGKYVGRDLYGKLGTGDVHIKMDSVNGDLKISRPNDGKTPSPVTNLLPQKEKSDEDWDKENDESWTKSSNEDKEAAKLERKAARDKRVAERIESRTIKSTAEAMKTAQREIEAAGPEIARVTSESVKAATATINSAAVQSAIRAGMQSQKVILARTMDAVFYPSAPRVDQKSDEIAVKGTPKVTIDATGCAVKVTGWDRPTVQYSVTQFSDVREREPIKATETHDGANVNIKIDNAGGTHRMRIEVFVPKHSNLNITTDREIRLDGVSGELELSGQDDSINVRDSSGNLHIASNDGLVRVVGFEGEIAAETNDGSINLEGDFQKLTAKADSGAINITLPENADARIVAESQNVGLDGLPAELVKSDENSREYRLGSGKAPFQIKTDGDVTLRGRRSVTIAKQ